ncbi:hypothetical protein BH20ACT2_BH20ACT2_11500 [soil metagenome]
MPGDPPDLSAAVAALSAGEAVVVPTDTVYGVAVAARVRGATAKLFALKRRPTGVPLAVLVADLAQAGELGVIEGAAATVAARWWPGPLTLVCRRQPGVELELGDDDTTIGLRCPDLSALRALARQVGPLATTSANRHGEPTPELAADAAAGLAGEVAVVVDGGRCAGLPSTVLDVTTVPWQVHREGAVSAVALGVISRE